MQHFTLSERALQRRLKRHFLKEQHDYFAVCTPGFEDVLLREVQELPGVDRARVDAGGVTFTGPVDALYHANLLLSSANRVLLRVAEFSASTTPMLFDQTSRQRWEFFVKDGARVRIVSSARKSKLNHHGRITETLAAGMNACLEPLGVPFTPTQEDAYDLELHVRLHRDRCTLSVNTSGEHLHRRGWRVLTSQAPIRETLAAAILRRTGLENEPGRVLIDPFCGSGTFLVEAAHLLSGYPPGAARPFAFERLPFFQESKWHRFRREAVQRAAPVRPRLLGFDLAQDVVDLARQNAAKAGVDGAIELAHADALSIDLSSFAGEEGTTLVANLPYGERLGDRQQVDALARRFAAKLNAKCSGWRVALVTGRAEHTRDLRLNDRDVLHFRNGGLKVALTSGVIA